MKGQKKAVIDEVLVQLPNFQLNIDNAAILLSTAQLEVIKFNIFGGITAGDIEYSKDRLNTAEVRSYSRSMVMNHLKKAKELNGGQTYKPVNTSTSTSAVKTLTVKEKIAPKGVNLDLLDEELKEFVKTLV